MDRSLRPQVHPRGDFDLAPAGMLFQIAAARLSPPAGPAAAGRRPGSFSVSAEGPVSFSEAGNASRSLSASPRPPRSSSFSASGLSSLCLARHRLPDGRDRFSARTNCSPRFPAGQSSEEPWFRKHVFYARRLSRSRQALCRALSITTCNRRP